MNPKGRRPKLPDRNSSSALEDRVAYCCPDKYCHAKIPVDSHCPGVMPLAGKGRAYPIPMHSKQIWAAFCHTWTGSPCQIPAAKNIAAVMNKYFRMNALLSQKIVRKNYTICPSLRKVLFSNNEFPYRCSIQIITKPSLIRSIRFHPVQDRIPSFPPARMPIAEQSVFFRCPADESLQHN